MSHENKANIDSPRKNGRQIAPGVLLVSPETSTANKPSQGNGGVPLVSVASNVANDFSVTDVQPTKQLDYFSQMLGFKTQYSEFPKVSINYKCSYNMFMYVNKNILHPFYNQSFTKLDV